MTPTPKPTQTDPAVVAFLAKLDHPLKPAIEELRTVILATSPEIREGIKWNAPSFRTTEWFATMNLRAKGGTERVWLILHLGAKVKADAGTSTVADPEGMLEWLGPDRALVTFGDLKEVRTKRSGLQALLREWIRHV